MRGERIACPDLKRLRITFAMTMLLAVALSLAGCGDDAPDPGDVLDRALTRENLSSFGNGPDGPAGGVVAVQALGAEDRVLEEREVPASPAVMTDIRDALGADNGLRGMVRNLEYEGTEQVISVETSHVSGGLEVEDLAQALEDAAGDEVSGLAGIENDTGLENSLTAATFDLYSGKEDGTIRRLDLTLAFDDPGNALPATRIRFSLTPESPNQPLK